MSIASSIKAGRAAIETYLDKSGLRRGLRSIEGDLRSAGARMSSIGARALGTGVAAGLPLAAAARSFASFEDKMLEVAAVSGATGDQYERLSQQSKELGRTTSSTAAEIAGLQAELGRAGFTPDQIIQATPAVRNLARATATELADAASIAGATLRGFGMEAAQSGRVADVLAMAANSSATTLTDLGEAMKMVAPIAAEAGASVEDTAAALGLLANNGLRGTMAGTALARAYKNLASGTADDALKRLGVAAADVNGDLRPIATILAEIGRATQGMGSADRLAIFEEMFGRASTAALKLAGTGTNFDDLSAKMNAARGAADRTSAKMDSGLGGTFRRVMSAAEGVSLAVGGALAGSLQRLEVGLTRTLEAIARFVEQNGNLVVTFGAAVAGLVAGGAALITMGAAASAASVVLGGLVTIAGAIVSPLGLAIASATALGVAFYKLAGAGEVFSKAFEGIKAALANGDFAAAGEIAMQSLEAAWLSGVSRLADIWYGWQQGIVEAFAGSMMSIYRLWVETQSKISKAIIAQASEDGVMGAAVRKWLGFDPRETEAAIERQLAFREKMGFSNEGLNFGDADFTQGAFDLIDQQAQQRIEEQQRGWLDTLATLQDDLDRRRAVRNDAATQATETLDASVQQQTRTRDWERAGQALKRLWGKLSSEVQAAWDRAGERVRGGQDQAASLAMAGSEGTFSSFRLGDRLTGATVDKQLQVAQQQLAEQQRMRRAIEEQEPGAYT